MTQVKQYLAQKKILKNESPKVKAKKVLARGGDLSFGISEKDQEFISKALYQAIIYNKQKGKKISLCVPIIDIEKIDLDSMIIEGSTCEALAKRTGQKTTKHNASLTDVYSHYGMVYLVTEDHEMLNTTLKVEEIEKEVIKEVKTVQTKANGIKEKDLLKAFQNTRHKMSKVWQPSTVDSILNELKKELKL